MKTDWHRSRHTGRYFIFERGYVEKVTPRKWIAGLFGVYTVISGPKEFTSLTEAKRWVESIVK